MTGQDLLTLRVNKGLSRRALARELGLHQESLRRLETDRSVRVSIAKKVADYFEVKVTDLPAMSVEDVAA